MQGATLTNNKRGYYMQATNFEVSVSGENTVIAASVNGVTTKTISMPTIVFQVLQSFQGPTANHVVQTAVATALGLAVQANGKNSVASAFIKRLTAGFSNFNGVIAVLRGSSEGRSRFYQFNETFSAETKTVMLTKRANPALQPTLGETVAVTEFEAAFSAALEASMAAEAYFDGYCVL